MGAVRLIAQIDDQLPDHVRGDFRGRRRWRNDTVVLGAFGGTMIRFGSKVSLLGGAGVDHFANTGPNQFRADLTVEDFEIDNAVGLPD